MPTFQINYMLVNIRNNARLSLCFDYAQIIRLVLTETLTNKLPAANCLSVRFGTYFGVSFIGHSDFT